MHIQLEWSLVLTTNSVLTVSPIWISLNVESPSFTYTCIATGASSVKLRERWTVILNLKHIIIIPNMAKCWVIYFMGCRIVPSNYLSHRNRRAVCYLGSGVTGPRLNGPCFFITIDNFSVFIAYIPDLLDWLNGLFCNMLTHIFLSGTSTLIS